MSNVRFPDDALALTVVLWNVHFVTSNKQLTYHQKETLKVNTRTNHGAMKHMEDRQVRWKDPAHLGQKLAYEANFYFFFNDMLSSYYFYYCKMNLIINEQFLDPMFTNINYILGILVLNLEYI